MTRWATDFLKDERGATAMEYGLIAALIAMVVITAWTLTGTSLSTRFADIANNVQH